MTPNNFYPNPLKSNQRGNIYPVHLKKKQITAQNKIFHDLFVVPSRLPQPQKPATFTRFPHQKGILVTLNNSMGFPTMENR